MISRVIWLGEDFYALSREEHHGTWMGFLTHNSGRKIIEFYSYEEQIDFVLSIVEFAKPTNFPLSFEGVEELYEDIYKTTSEKMLDSGIWKTLIEFGLVVV